MRESNPLIDHMADLYNKATPKERELLEQIVNRPAN